jgi:branched-subunit amino acid aminotransferase/4-amino-4-deoxychorismate lyase
MSTTGTALFRWHDGSLQPLDYCDPAETSVLAADSWLVSDGQALALPLHRDRFFDAISRQTGEPGDDLALEAFWGQVIAAIPRTGDQFPRVELQASRDATHLVYRQRPAPELTLSVRLWSHPGPDPRGHPTIKGPDTPALLTARTDAQSHGADEAVILSPQGYVVEGAHSALLWWRGDILCAPSPELERIDSVTARSVLALAAATGVEVHYESVPPEALDGLEVWCLSALHGIRIVTAWVNGPAPAEEPGRLASWRSRLERLRKPLSTDLAR